jgi:ribose transport system substrate-binding protein
MGPRWLIGCVAAVAIAMTAAGGSSARPSDLAAAKAIVVIPAGAQVPQIASMSAFTGAIRQAATAAGVKVTMCSNHGERAVQTACLGKAVGNKANLVILVGPLDVVGLASPLTSVKKAGIPVIASHVLASSDFGVGIDPSSTAATDYSYARALDSYKRALAGLTATVPAPYAQAAKLIADYAVAEANGSHINVILGEMSDLIESAPMLKMVENEFAAQCPAACSLGSIDMPYSQWSPAPYGQWDTTTISNVLNASLAQPTQYVLPLFDGVDGIVAEGSNDVRSASATGIRPSVCSFGGAPFAIQMGQAGNRVTCDVAENMRWDGWATMDQALRVLTGAKPLSSENLPVLLWNQTSLNWFAPGMTYPPTIDAGWGDPATTYIAGYQKLWGLNT